jgi:hypothetical protein
LKKPKEVISKQTIQWQNEKRTKEITIIYKPLHTKNKRLNHMKSTKHPGGMQVIRKGKQFLLY